MKNYIANGKALWCIMHRRELDHQLDSGSWDTSKAYVRRTLEKCIELGRRYRHAGKPNRDDKYEAFRLLGAAVSSFPLRVMTLGR